MSEYILEFEIPLKKIHDKIETLKNSSVSTGIDVKASIDELEQKYVTKCKSIKISEILSCTVYKQQLKLNNNQLHLKPFP